ncbi:MAG: UDP-N-acetylmuramate dehydrogenase [Gammaproteobacteria bacterium]|nr:UDP-N-acetylmuramate dehydrogenase [Gammaproteobacteria bacterium]
MIALDMNQLSGRLRQDEPMSKHTSWRVGGLADQYYVPANLADLQIFLSMQDVETPITWVGLGSNMLVRDGGIRGVVIAPLGGLKELYLDDQGLVYAQCGLSNSKVARFCDNNNLSGAEYLAGIPGTIGGALTMNAGAFGHQTWDLVEQVTMINRKGELIERYPNEFEISYRDVRIPPDEWFVAGRLRLGKKVEGQNNEIKQLLQKRNDSQPIGLPSCGSVFKNPPGKHSAQLIESAGLKGYCMGSACVSEKHANFIISKNGTKASDIEALIGFIQKTIKQQFDVSLETEVRIVGEVL